MNKVAAIVGVGPGLGSSVARKFAREGYKVALMARTEDKLIQIQKEIEQSGGQAISIPTDAADEHSVKQAFHKIRSQWGSSPSVLVYNAGYFKMKSILDTSVQEFQQGFNILCTGCLIASQQVLPDMIKARQGTILITGATASLRSGNQFVNLAVGKFGVRALSQSMAREFGPQGVHVSHIIVDGMIDTGSDFVKGKDKNSLLNPDALAQVYWNLHTQDPTVWTHEIDVRPSIEKW